MRVPAVQAALSYASRGWAVFPCHSIREPGGCSCYRADCASPAKHPKTAGGLTAATTDPSTIEQWWHRWPNANVAIRTGAASGIVVLDIDPDHGGETTIDRLIAEHGPLPSGAVVRIKRKPGKLSDVKTGQRAAVIKGPQRTLVLVRDPK